MVILLLSFSLTTSAQNLMLENEISIFNFKTKKGKIVSLSKDKNDEYIIYRYGTEQNIELEFPEKNNESWTKFKFNSLSKHGGKENSGMEICNVMFENENSQYIISTSRYGDDDSAKPGLYVINLNSKKVIKISGVNDSQEGYLCNFKYNNLLTFGDFDLYE